MNQNALRTLKVKFLMLAIPEHEIKIIKNLSTEVQKHKKFNEKIYNKLIKRRMLGEPIHYIEG